MDKASDYESGDSRFESLRDRLFFLRENEKKRNDSCNIQSRCFFFKNCCDYVIVYQIVKESGFFL